MMPCSERSKFFALTCVLTFLIHSNSLWAWGKTGHRVVGEVAQQHLTPLALLRIKELLKKDSLAEASTFADEVKSDRAWNHTHSHHYINLPDGFDFDTYDSSTSGNIIWAISHYKSQLLDAKVSLDEKVVALKFLVHLVGDLHQPLHVGKSEDRGGNDFQVSWFGVPSNLHRVWDENLIDFEQLSFLEFTKFIDSEVAQLKKAATELSALAWAKESYELREKCYPGQEGVDLKYDYHYQHKDLIRQRLALAGLRLAGMLNQIFK